MSATSVAVTLKPLAFMCSIHFVQQPHVDDLNTVTLGFATREACARIAAVPARAMPTINRERCAVFINVVSYRQHDAIRTPVQPSVGRCRYPDLDHVIRR